MWHINGLVFIPGGFDYVVIFDDVLCLFVRDDFYIAFCFVVFDCDCL